MRSKFLIVTITCILLSAMFAGCGGSPEIGEVVSGDIWQVRVISVENETRLEGTSDRWWSTEEGYLFLVVGLRISNISTEDQGLPQTSLTLTDSEKRVYTPVGWGDWSWPIGGEGGVYYELGFTATMVVHAGDEISGETPSDYVVFAVPDDAEGFYFKFQDLPEIYLGQ
jgi:hypothetical protein